MFVYLFCTQSIGKELISGKKSGNHNLEVS